MFLDEILTVNINLINDKIMKFFSVHFVFYAFFENDVRFSLRDSKVRMWNYVSFFHGKHDTNKIQKSS
jgi:hypothetical protein